jgi:DNA-binding transcriptional MerR regulator
MLMIKHDDALKTIGEVSSLIEIPVYVIRFWETKFKDLNPIKKNKGSRYYSKDQIDLLKKIKYLLYEKKMTIKGAIQNIEKFDNQKKIIIDEIKELINEIKNNL